MVIGLVLVIGKDFSLLMIFSVMVLCLMELGLVLGLMVEILLMIGKGTCSPLGVFAHLGHAELMGWSLSTGLTLGIVHGKDNLIRT